MKKQKRMTAALAAAVMILQLLVPQTVQASVLPGAERQETRTGTVYYVDSAAGNDQALGTSETVPWKSLDKINETVFQPGDKILLKAGGSWYGELYPKGSGLEGSPITIDMYGEGEKPLIDGEGKVKSAVKLRNQEYWEINNLEVTNWSEEIGYYAGIRITAYEEPRAYKHIVIRDCYIHDVHGVREFGPTDTTGISEPRRAWYEDGYSSDWFKGTGGIAIVTEDQTGTHTTRHSHGGNSYEVLHETEFNGYEGKTWFDDILIENNIIEEVSETGIRIAQSAYLPAYSAGTSNCIPFTNIVIRGNVINGGLEWSDFGMLITPTKDPLVEYNIAHDWRTSGLECTNTTDGIFQFNEVYNVNHWETTRTADDCAFDADLNSSNVIFQYNYAHDSGSAFLACSASNKSPIIYRYNIAQDISNRIMYGPAPGIFYNNTFYSPDAVNTISVAGGMPVYNNIIYAKKLNTSSGITMDSNLYGGGCKPPAADKNAVVGDPMFVDPGKGKTGTEVGSPAIDSLAGYQLLVTSPAIDRGRRIEDNGGRDYFGNPLYLDTPDIGAHEYSNADKPKDKVDLIVLEKDRIHMTVGESRKLNASVFPESVINKNLVFSSDNEEIVSVDGEGGLRAAGVGSVVITVTSEADPTAFAVCTVIVSEGSGKIILGALEDEFVRHGASYGNVTENSAKVNGDLHVQTDSNPGWVKEAYLKFDLGGVTFEENQKYLLRLYSPFLESAADEMLTLSEAPSDWSEKTINGSNKPAAAAEIGTYAVKNPTPGTNYTDGIWIEFDVTEYMKSRDNTNRLITLVISNKAAPHAKCRIDFRSKDSAGDHPQFVAERTMAVPAKELFVETEIGVIPELPLQAECIDANGQTVMMDVSWESLTEDMVSRAGIYEIKGRLADGGEVLLLMKVFPVITFDTNYEGGEAVMEKIKVEFGKPVGELVEAVRDGFKFLGWNTKPDGTGKMYTKDTIYDAAGNMELYAVWRDREDIHTIGLNMRRVYLNLGETYLLEADIYPETAVNREVLYSSDNTEIVTADSDGTLYAAGIGTATITAVSLEDSTVSAQCQVIVKDNELGDDVMVSEFPSVDDAFVRNGGYGSVSQHTGDGIDYIMLKCSDPGYAREGYIQFDLNDCRFEKADSVILKLHAFAAGSKTDTQVIRVYRTDPGWSESDVTYNQAPTPKEMVGEFTLANLPVTANGTELSYDQWVNVDITDHINTILEDKNGDRKVSFRLVHMEQEGEAEYGGMYSGNSVKFDSRHVNDESLRPQIVLKKSNHELEDELIIVTEARQAPKMPETLVFKVASASNSDLGEKKQYDGSVQEAGMTAASPSNASPSNTSPVRATSSNALPLDAMPIDASPVHTALNDVVISTIRFETDVEWEDIDESWFAEEGSFQVLGWADGISGEWEVVATVIVEKAREPETAELSGITIKKLPNKITYQRGQLLDLSGLEVMADYSDGSSKTVSDYTTSIADNTLLTEVGETEIMVVYTENQRTERTSFTVTVKPGRSDGGSTSSRSSKTPNSESGQWRRDTRGWWLQNLDGSYAVNEWRKVSGKWYHFDKMGYMQTGWLKDIDGKWYFLNADGSMQTGWLKDKDGKWYFLNDDGSMRIDSLEDGDKRYDFNDDGSLRAE